MSESEKAHLAAEAEKMKEQKEAEKPSFEVVEATPEDAERIAYIQRDSWLATYPNEEVGITRADLEKKFADMPSRIERRRKSMEEAEEGTKNFLIKKDGMVIGFCQVTKEADENHIDALYLDPDYKKQKAGATIFQKSLEWLGDDKPTSLEVVAYNDRAIKFYQDFGFEDAGEAEPSNLGIGTDQAFPKRTMRRPAAEIDPAVEEVESGSESTKEILDLQLKFANEIVEKTGKSLGDVLLNYTRLYKAFGLKGKRDPENPTWKEFVDGLGVEPLLDRAYAFYQRRERNKNPEGKQFGCFRFDYDDGTVNIHFGNNDTSGKGPLHPDQLDDRRKELAEMFGYIKANVPDAKVVKGSSWLYNLDRYKNLFPKTYGDSAKPEADDFQSGSLWGQFIDHKGHVRKDKATKMLEKVKNIPPDELTAERLTESFEYPVQEVEAPIEDFYTMFQIK